MVAVMTEPEAAKAATVTPGGEMAFWSFPIEKVTDVGDGCVEVAGKATDGTLDSDLQIVDPDWSRKALKEWFETGGNVRVQHNAQRDPAGRGIDLDDHWIKVRVVEPVAAKLVKAGVLQDFSVGIMNPDCRRGDPRFRHLDPQGKAVNGILTGRDDGMSKIGEVSLVDRGSNFSTKFALVKAAADGTPQWVEQLSAPDDVLAKVSAPGSYKTVSVELPSDMKLKFSPAQLAKMQTLARAAVTKVAEPAGAKAEEPEEPDEALKAVMAAEAAVYKRDIDTASRRRLAAEGHALPNLSYPIENTGDLQNAAHLARTGHGDVSAARGLIARRARELGVKNPLKGGKKKAEKGHEVAGGQMVTTLTASKCMKCDGSGMAGEAPCPDCKKGRKKARMAAKAAAPAEVKKKKTKVMCSHCGAKQNVKHAHCPECGNQLHPGAIPVMSTIQKNHDFACLGCGGDLDKGERFCPGCGKENPGYLEVADRKLPMNKAGGKDRVQATTKSKKNKGKKGKPFGGNQAKPFGAADDDGDEKQDAGKPKPGKPKAEKRRKGKGKGRSPAAGVHGQETQGLPPHREPDGAPVEAFEQDTRLEDGDHEMKAATRLQTLGIDRDLGVLHDLTCPAFKASDVAVCYPTASFGMIDTELWQRKALDAASGADITTAMARYNEMAALSRHAVTLKTADPQVLADVTAEQHGAFLAANKTFADAAPGPGSFPTPSHPMPGQFRRPYLSAGHGAASPQHGAPRSFGVPEGQIAAADFDRGFLTDGRAADAPANSTPRHEPQPQPMTGGQPETVHYQGTMRANVASAVSAMHDHVSRIFPGVCPMSPPVGEGQKPAPGVPAAAGGPEPHRGKAAKPKKSKAERKAAAARKTAKVAQRKARMARKAARAEIRKARAAGPGYSGSTPLEEMAPPADVQSGAIIPDAEALKAAITAATRPLVKKLARQDRQVRKLRKTASAIADQPDTTGAPFRGAGVAKTASATLAGPLTAAKAAEQAQTAYIQRLVSDWRGNPNPEMREAAWAELTTRYGINPMTGPTPDHSPLT